MKKLFLLLSAVGMIFTACEKVDLSDIYDRLDTVENQLGISHDFNDKIYYTTSDNTKLFPKTDASFYGAILISNTYKDGQGVLTFDDSVTSIGNMAFHDCTSLTTITIPDSVTSIGYAAVASCTSLKEVYCKATTPPTGETSMFSNNASGRKIYVPRNSVSAYKAAQYWSDYADYIEGYDF